MIEHFQAKIKKLQREVDFDINLEMNQEKREEFRVILSNLIGVKNNNSNTSLVNQQQLLKSGYGMGGHNSPDK